jgi:general L-amino acid transport system permease protein
VIFAYLALVLTVFPRIEDAWRLDGVVVASNRGVVVPWLAGSALAVLVTAVVAVAASLLAGRWRRGVSERTGAPARDLGWSLVTFAVIVVGGTAAAGNRLTLPNLDGRQVSGGITLQPEFFALLLALVIYTASHIAEIVRGSIQAVAKGQFEAASALALGSWDRMRYVVLPQALRIAVPPIGNQYLNLLKNSSLGFAISYFELTKVTATTIGNRSPAVPAYLLLMAVYLVMSLTISALVNVANRRLQVVSR